MHKLVGPRLPERRQVRLAQLSETFLQFIVGQSVNNDQTFALSLVGYRGYGKDLFGRAADLVKLVFDLDMGNHFSANLAEPGQAIGNPDESILIHRSDVTRVIPATPENLSGLFRTVQISLHDIWDAHLVGPRLPERGQVRLAQLSETFLQFIVGQSVNNDQTFALSLVGYRGYGKDLFGRAGTCSVINRLPSFVAASIKSGPNSRRFEELRSISSPTVNRVWQHLKVVSCWADGHATGAAQQLAQSLGSVVLQPKGLIATEGIISISFEGRHPLAIRSHYLEFEDDSGHLLLSSELQEKHEYHVILTTGGGLCRYRLDDRIAVDGMLGRTPSIRFVGKSAQVSDRMGEKLSDGFVASVFSKLFEGVQIRPSFAMLAPDVDANGCRYTLYLSADASSEMCAKLDLLLSANPHYAYCRRLTQLCLPRLFRVSDDACTAYYQRLLPAGKRLGEVKPVGLSALDGWSNYLSGYYID